MSSKQGFFSQISASPEELFNFLVRRLNPPLVMDIGSRDATEAKRFKRMSPSSEVIAVEPHPALFASMQADGEIEKLSIRTINVAVADKPGELTFYINDAKALNGSLRKTSATVAQVDVKVERLDVLTEPFMDRCPFFLWIDVEGLAWEVLRGGARTLECVACIHIEYETEALFEGQKTFPEVKALLQENGFRQWANTYCAEVSQGNALFVRSGPKGMPLHSMTLLLSVYPWFLAKVLYRRLKSARSRVSAEA